jgi:benzoate/toluate 1,2-dioxygenase reductase subunit
MSSASNSNWPKAIPWISVLASLSRSRCRGRKSCAAIRWRRWPPIFPRIELLIRILPGGIMSGWLENQAKPDDVVEIRGPYGQFFLKEKVREPHIMIAGGTGLAPMLSMLAALRRVPAASPKRSSASAASHPKGSSRWISWICISNGHLRFKCALRWIAALHPLGCKSANPVEALTPADGLTPDSVAYLCGPPRHDRSGARAHLEALGPRAG